MADAGKRWHRIVFPAHAGVIPRVLLDRREAHGLPRACGGDPPQPEGQDKREVVFPAHAGVIPSMQNADLNYNCLPRACGGDPRRENWKVS